MPNSRAVTHFVPQDVSVTGFDDLDLASCTTPTLTTVRVAADEIGYQAANRLIAQVTGNGPRESLELPVTLISRDSRAISPTARSRDPGNGRAGAKIAGSDA